MKRILIAFILIIIFSIIKYYTANYYIKYTVDGYDVKINYKNNRFYFELKKDITYNFDLLQKRELKKNIITKIKESKIKDYSCITPYINNKELYPICYDNNNKYLINHSLVNEQVLEDKEYKNDFEYNKNLKDNEYIAFWNYRGYIIMNGKKYNNINIFENDRYDNNLSILIENNIFMPNYDQNHEYNELIKLNLETQNYEKIKINANIDFDSYIVGNIKKYIYIFDNKNEKLFKINKNNGKTEEISNNEIGYVKYYNGKFIDCSKYEYKTKKIVFNTTNSTYYDYIEENGVFKVINENKNIKTKIINDKVKIIYKYKDVVYYVLENKLFSFDEKNGSKSIFYNFELNFNNTNTIFIYIK